MNHEQDKRNAAFFYSVHLLKMLLKAALITGQEYERIRELVARHYGCSAACPERKGYCPCCSKMQYDQAKEKKV